MSPRLVWTVEAPEKHRFLMAFRVAKYLRYGRYICVKISKMWGKKFVGIQNRQLFGHTLTTTVAFFYKTAFKIQFLP